MYRVDYEDEAAYISYLHTLAVTDCNYVVKGGGTCLRELTICTERHKHDLYDEIKEGPLSPRDVVIFAHDVIAGVHHLHTRGIIHCDIKPDNVLISAAGRAILADFDLSQVYSPHTHDCAYAIPYRPPEIIWSGGDTHKCRVTPAADMWALGSLLCDIQLGESPFRRASMSTDCTISIISAVFGAPHKCAWDPSECKISDDLANITRDAAASALKLGDLPLKSLILDTLRFDPAERVTAYAALMAARELVTAAGHGALLPAPPSDIIKVAPDMAAHAAALCAAFRGKYPDLPPPDQKAAKILTRAVYKTRRGGNITPHIDILAPLLDPGVLAAAWNG